MKYLFLFILCLASFASYSQDSELKQFRFKGCNTVVIQAPDSGSALFNRFLTHLEDRGYFIDKSDKDRLTFSTQLKSFKKNLSAQMLLKGQVRGTRIYLSGVMQLRSLSGKTFDEPIVDEGMSGSQMREAFNSLDNTAGLFTDTERFYLLR